MLYVYPMYNMVSPVSYEAWLPNPHTGPRLYWIQCPLNVADDWLRAGEKGAADARRERSRIAQQSTPSMGAVAREV